MENVPVGPNSKPLRPVIVTEVRAFCHQYLSLEVLLFYSLLQIAAFNRAL
jgi:hypothetical protein